MSKGNVEKRGKNSYRLSYVYNSKLYRKTITASNMKEARKELKKWIQEIERKNSPMKKYTIREFSKTWIQKQVIPNSKTERTPDKYRNFLVNWFYPKFGNRYVYDITTEEMVDYINWLRVQKSKYSRKENKQLSFYTVLKYKNILHAMFETAKDWDIISKNPCNFKIINTDFSDRRLNYFRYSEYVAILEQINKDKQEVLKKDYPKKIDDFSKLVMIELVLKTGMREAEVFGLTKYPYDVDLYERMIDINKDFIRYKKKDIITSPKTRTSRRRISIPKSIIPSLEILLEMIPKKEKFLFYAVNKNSITAWLIKWLENNNFRRIRFHDLRHTHASILLYKGVDVKTISERLGHSDILTTLNIYTHIIAEQNQRVSDILDDL